MENTSGIIYEEYFTVERQFTFDSVVLQSKRVSCNKVLSDQRCVCAMTIKWCWPIVHFVVLLRCVVLDFHRRFQIVRNVPSLIPIHHGINYPKEPSQTSRLILYSTISHIHSIGTLPRPLSFLSSH
jgi:uncharacterized membrane protein